MNVTSPFLHLLGWNLCAGPHLHDDEMPDLLQAIALVGLEGGPLDKVNSCREIIVTYYT